MKKVLLLLLMSLLPQLIHAEGETAKAIWCLGNTTLYFSYDSSTYAVGDAYDGQTITAVYDVDKTGYVQRSIERAPYRIHSSAPWDGIADQVTNVNIAQNFVNYTPTSLGYWFCWFRNLNAITGIENMNTSNCTSMTGAFLYCSSLTTLDLSCWDTSNVRTMLAMFSNCSSLTSLTLYNRQTGDYWETGNVVSMLELFMNCSSLTSLDVTKFDTSNVKSMANMFYGCKSLTELDVTHFVTDMVEGMNGMFSGCSGLETLNVTNFKTSNVTNMASMFSSCRGLTTLDVTIFDTSNVTNMASMFADCRGLTELDIRNFETAKVGKMNAMFKNCFALESLKYDLQKFITSNVDDMSAMFQNCTVLTSLDVTNFDTDKVKNMENMFGGCNSLAALDVTNFKTSNVTNMGGMFSSCKGITALNVTQFDTSNVTDMHSMFAGCSALTALDVTNFVTSNVTNMYSMFSNCSTLTTLDVTNFVTSNVTDMHFMFVNCRGLTALDVTNFDTRNVTSMYGMFSNIPFLTKLTFGENFSTECIQQYHKTSNADSYAAYDGYPQFWAMFAADFKLRYIDFNASNDIDAINSVDRTNYTDMFHNVPRTTVIYLPHGSSSVTDAENVVYTGNDPMAGGGSHGGGAPVLKCPNYYSADKTDIEFPRDFRTNKAEYSRTMSTNYGSVVLPYAFKTNADIQAYTLDEEHTETMYFVDAEEIPAHTPFAFKKMGSAQFINEDATGRFGITVKATQTTSAAEGGTPYTSSEHLDGWTTKGYYVNETVNDYAGAFYIAGDKFYKADGALTMYPHRVTFHGAWNTEPSSDSPAKFFEIATVSKPAEEQPEDVTPETDDLGLADAIETAELRREMRETTAIYDAQGRKQNELKRGLNIIREQDGSMKKVIIR